MSIAPGTYEFGPDNGTLSVRTGRTGAAAKAGHDLLLHVTSWQATLTVPDDPHQASIELTADAGSLRVREGTGGMQALGEDDVANIQQTIDDEVLKRQAISFRSSEVRPAADGSALHVQGELTVIGKSHPNAFDVAVGEDGTLGATATVKQTDYGMKPYSILFGALKVADEVKVELTARLPQSA